MPGEASLRSAPKTGPIGISWSNSYTGEQIATGLITANMQGDWEGWFHIQLGSLDQWIILVPCRRPFGGHQWYFMCPVLNRRASVLWRPPGATRFASRQAWGRQVAYNSQFLDRDNRAHQSKAKINSKLCQIGGFDPDDWDFPPKPKWMRWQTYRRHEANFDHYEGVLDEGLLAAIARLKLSGFRF